MRTPHPNNPLSGRSPHLFVTRAATLAYQEITGAPFETARRALTERILSGARADRENNGCYLFTVQLPTGLRTLRIWTHREGKLVVVPRVVAVEVDTAH